jgi:hypothetical protein
MVGKQGRQVRRRQVNPPSRRATAPAALFALWGTFVKC